jgi:2-aminoadipate transaminase
MFLFVRLPQGMNANLVLQHALDEKVAFVPGEEFHLNGGGTNTLRLNFSNPTPERISQGICRLGAVIGNML